MKKTKIKGLNINISTNNIQIEEAYKIKTSDKMETILLEILKKNNNYYITERTLKSFIKQWKTYNRLYNWKIFRKNNINYNFKNTLPIWYKRLYYFIFGI